mmetsp:Transcript_39090/g.91979  ORF Transcript_39090/g.91979 Transcript_39090/m.91979 type:complete len:200 (+) Transcript_39090:1019-1618(+)
MASLAVSRWAVRKLAVLCPMVCIAGERSMSMPSGTSRNLVNPRPFGVGVGVASEAELIDMCDRKRSSAPPASLSATASVPRSPSSVPVSIGFMLKVMPRFLRALSRKPCIIDDVDMEPMLASESSGDSSRCCLGVKFPSLPAPHLFTAASRASRARRYHWPLAWLFFEFLDAPLFSPSCLKALPCFARTSTKKPLLAFE